MNNDGYCKHTLYVSDSVSLAIATYEILSSVMNSLAVVCRVDLESMQILIRNKLYPTPKGLPKSMLHMQVHSRIKSLHDFIEAYEFQMVTV